MAPLADVLRTSFDLGEPEAFFAAYATKRHGAALVAAMSRGEAEERIVAATRELRKIGSPFTFRMLRSS